MTGLAGALVPRLGRSLLTLVLVVTAVFVILRWSGDPVRLLLPPEATVDQVEALRRQLGLDRPIPVQYAAFWRELARGNFGESMRFNRPAMDLVLERFPATAQLAVAAFAIAATFGLLVGVLAAFKRGSAFDRAAMGLMGVLQSAPSFFLGIMLILVFSVRLGWLPTSGYGSWRQLILPAAALGALTMASIARLARSALADVLRADFVRTARAKGLGEAAIVVRHAMRNASLPLVTMLGLELAQLLTGAVIVETVFAWPGMGRLAVDAVATRDYPVVQAAVFLFAFVFVGVNFAVDLSYALLDPRVRRG